MKIFNTYMLLFMASLASLYCEESEVEMATETSNSASASTLVYIKQDSDGDLLDDAFERLIIDHDLDDTIAELGDVDPSGDYDGDDVSNLQEYLAGMNPVDYYNGQLHVLEVLAGTNGQDVVYGGSTPQPIVFHVKSSSDQPLDNAPVSLSVLPYVGQLSSDGGNTFFSEKTLRADVNGEIAVDYYAVAGSGTEGCLASASIEIFAATVAESPEEVVANIQLVVDSQIVDADGDGMDDRWEELLGLDVGVDDSLLDSDHDGVHNLQEYTNAVNGETYAIFPGLWDLQVGVDSDGDGVNNEVDVRPGDSSVAAQMEVIITYPADGAILP